jgi:DNA processing protein
LPIASWNLAGRWSANFPLATFAVPQNFPIPNRIINGLSLGVLIVEAGEYGGTRVTARCALEQSRELFAVPGNLTSRNCWGPNTLIKQGAKLTATWEDVWEELPAAVKLELESERDSQASDDKPEASSLFGNVGQLSPKERKSSLSFARTNPFTSIRSWSGWRRTFRLSKCLPLCSSWS